jgi:predicted MFS family arabinose efflux permease
LRWQVLLAPVRRRSQGGLPIAVTHAWPPVLHWCGILLDFAVQGNVVLGQRAIFSLGAHVRSRLNGLYLAIFFLGGAAGSALASLAFEHGGWIRVCQIGVAFPLVGLGLFFYHCMAERAAHDVRATSAH